jgi:hypothetical protein
MSAGGSVQAGAVARCNHATPHPDAVGGSALVATGPAERIRTRVSQPETTSLRPIDGAGPALAAVLQPAVARATDLSAVGGGEQ